MNNQNTPFPDGHYLSPTGSSQLAFKTFYRLMNATSNIHTDAGIFGLMDRKVVNVFKGLKEYNRYIPGLRSWTGFRQTGILIEQNPRYDNSPRASLRRLIGLALNGIFSFSILPLRIFTIICIIISFFGMMGICVVFYKILIHNAILGWSSTLISIFLSLEIQMMFLGVISEYLGRIYDETKRRPLYVVDKTINV